MKDIFSGGKLPPQDPSVDQLFRRACHSKRLLFGASFFGGDLSGKCAHMGVQIFYFFKKKIVCRIFGKRVFVLLAFLSKGRVLIEACCYSPYSLYSSSAPRRETESQKQKEEIRLSNWLRGGIRHLFGKTYDLTVNIT